MSYQPRYFPQPGEVRGKGQFTRTWGVHYDMFRPDGALDGWSKYYRTRFGARIAIWFRVKFSPLGGVGVVFKNTEKGKK